MPGPHLDTPDFTESGSWRSREVHLAQCSCSANKARWCLPASTTRLGWRMRSSCVYYTFFYPKSQRLWGPSQDPPPENGRPRDPSYRTVWGSVALATGSVPSACNMVHTCLLLQFQGLWHHFWPPRAPDKHMVHEHICCQNTETHTDKINTYLLLWCGC